MVPIILLERGPSLILLRSPAQRLTSARDADRQDVLLTSALAFGITYFCWCSWINVNYA